MQTFRAGAVARSVALLAVAAVLALPAIGATIGNVGFEQPVFATRAKQAAEAATRA